MPRGLKPIKKVIRSGMKSTRVLYTDGTDGLVSNERLKEQFGIDVLSSRKINVQIPKDISVSERFVFMGDLVSLVIHNHTNSVIVAGIPGSGKSYLVLQQLEKEGYEVLQTKVLKDEEDDTPEVLQGYIPEKQYVMVKGHASAFGLYKTLHDHRTDMVVFDDCDSIFKDKTSVNILKAALDSYDKRFVSWVSPRTEQLGVEPTFEFTGRIIFVSNMDESRMDGAIKSRSFVINLTLTREEIVERMKEILPDVIYGMDMAVKQEVLEFIIKNKDSFINFNLRTLVKALRVRASNTPHWQKLVKYYC